MSDRADLVIANPWQALRQFTDARIALGRVGASLPTNAHLAFQLAHAQARDAVHLALDAPRLAQDIGQPCLRLHSAAADRITYLQRPDLGRQLDAASRALLAPGPYDLAFVIADGLSAHAIMQNAAPFLALVLAQTAAENWSVAPLCLVEQGRVAIGDEIAERLGAQMVVVLIGERPGLSAPDSMGLYLTWQPHVGLTDASRNCISNVRPAGLRHAEAADKLHYLLKEAFRRRLTGVALKDETGAAVALPGTRSTNFLIG
ncbi:ethanolamine ammonia-lyase subunit EutC [Actimicrobium sp. CCI2.3]|uniref:ethanolamine ammonia-lyase subunit EutC n=1 Tax=Actimicrobium sp. CCI2.3 TaxID=3048616 RepID=UPI002AB5AA85|nr:ethanolamine ammonia-lyase subunit EutC [Actimicrobium sp. CCI2.3]MDY7573180.1 ethanolamine ammonia-lyase subunit EutC [Actimicrobium sp. CCI2.3]MEB0022159.1 ethanolamine ammonia-lyase subunit EutC [Actimicrobium sp. CCI2.3]